MADAADVFEDLIRHAAAGDTEEKTVHSLAEALLNDFGDQLESFAQGAGAREMHLVGCSASALIKIVIEAEGPFSFFAQQLRNRRAYRLVRLAIAYGLWLGRRGARIKELSR